MANKLQQTDSLPSWAIKVNDLIDDVNELSQAGGLFQPVSPSDGDFVVYDSGFKNKGITGPIIVDASYGSTGPEIKFAVQPEFITGATELLTSPDADDYLLIYDDSAGILKKIEAIQLSSPPGGANTQVQYNALGVLAGSSGMTYDQSNSTLTVGGLTVDSPTLFVDRTNHRLGVGTITPSYALHVAGDANLSTGSVYRINGTQVITATALGSSITSSSLTSLGTITTLSAGTGTFSSSVSSNSLVVTNSGSFGTTLTVTGIATFNNHTVHNATAFINMLSVTTSGTIGTTLDVGTVLTAGSFTTAGAAAVGSLTINSKSLSLSGNTTIGSSTHTVAFATTGNTSVTLPTSGTLLSSTVTTLSSLTSVGTLTNLQSTSLGVGTAASGVSGEIRATNNITAYYSSDISLKENIQRISNPLEKISRIRGVSFDWKKEFMDERGGEDGVFVRKHDVGVVAQEVVQILPEVVAQREDGTLAVNYEKIVPLLIECINELQLKVSRLENK